jgi:uncharacterized protein YbbC (DUF1343 family)
MVDFNRMKRLSACLLFFFCFSGLQCGNPVVSVGVGAESTSEYFPLLKGKRIGIFTTHTGRVGDEHTVDFLLRSGFNLVVIFAPEHGFRGNADAGEQVNDSKDSQTGIPIYSLYKDKTGKPGKEILSQIDVVLMDIQDVGLRFYTYYISMYKLMDACAGSQKEMIILDRPNPNGFYVDGPILDMKYRSGVGYLPIPVVHGMTLGELALMINGEKWLPGQQTCPLRVITCKNYTHQTKYSLPLPPSPNLPNMKAVYLYPSLCLFEGTPLSVGRGTDFPFQVYGSPDMSGYSFSFTPRSIPGAKYPPHVNKKCYGVDLRNLPDSVIWEGGLNLEYVIDAYNRLKSVLSSSGANGKFFTPFFRNLIGVDYVDKMIMEGKSAKEIKKCWQTDVEKFKNQRKHYLLYE